MAEPNAMGNVPGISAGAYSSSGISPTTVGSTGISGGPTPISPISGITNAATGSVNANTGLITSTFNALTASLKKLVVDSTKLTGALKGLTGPMNSLINSVTKLGSVSKTFGRSAVGASGIGSGGGRGAVGTALTVFNSGAYRSSKDLASPIAASSTPTGGDQRALPPGGSTGGWSTPARMVGGGSGGGGGNFGNGGGFSGNFSNPSGGGADSDAGQNLTTGVLSATNNFIQSITGQNGIGGLLMAGLTGLSQLYGAVAGSGIQYAYNRINGPAGNQNQMLQLAGALGPQAGMMGITLPQTVLGLAQKMPVMGTQEDMIATALAGQSVGSFMRGTPGRNGFFEAVRQMQVLTPGADPGQMAGSLAGYLQNTQSQKMGMFLGEGAFTMIGKGGRYKSLAEWAAGITKFMEQHRISGQGTEFTKQELMAQNFPGSNINAWFQMLGVPQNMIDYWWNYALNAAKDDEKQNVPAIAPTTQALTDRVRETRGLDLSYERLRNVTQGTRRDYIMGNKMYGMYAARESADRRFNVGMQVTDASIADMMSRTNVGALMSLLPTPIMEALMPILMAVATSPVGAAAALTGGVLGDVPIGDVPIGDFGNTTTAHLSPSLAKNVKAMMAANPRLKISSGYRDTSTQNRLYRNGVGRVGPASTSAHTRGWAVDIGPKSEGRWLAANAGKFGLQSAAHKGEPWHIQMANTMTVGDISTGGSLGDMPVGDIFDDIKNAVTGIPKFLFGLMQDLALKPFKAINDVFSDLLKGFITGGNLSKSIDTGIGVFSKLITAPLLGLSKSLGMAEFSPEDISKLVDQSANIPVPVAALEGFQSLGSNSNSGQLVFGDPPSSLMNDSGNTFNTNMGSPIIFNATINLTGGVGNQTDARRAAATLVDHIESEISKRKWLVS